MFLAISIGTTMSIRFFSIATYALWSGFGVKLSQQVSTAPTGVHGLTFQLIQLHGYMFNVLIVMARFMCCIYI